MSSLKTSQRCPNEENSKEKLKESHHYCGDENIEEEEISKSKTTTTIINQAFEM